MLKLFTSPLNHRLDLKKLWSVLLQIGFDRADQPSKAQKIKTTNLYALVLSMCAAIVGICLLTLHLYPMGLLALGIALAFCLVIGAHAWRWDTAARVLLLTILNAAIYVFSTTLGRDSFTHVWFITSSILPFAIFNLDERRLLLASSLSGFVSFLFVWLSGFRFTVIPLLALDLKALQVISTMMLILALSTTILIVFMFASEMQQWIVAVENNSSSMVRNHLSALNSTCIILHTDISGKITYVNERYCTLSGYSREELLGRVSPICESDFHPPEFLKQIWQSLSSNEIWSGEFRHRAKNGDIYWLMSTIIPTVDSSHRITEYVAIKQDITESKKTEATIADALKASLKSEASYRSFFDNSAVGVIKLDSQMRFLAANTVYTEFMEYSEEELKQLTVRDVTYHEDRTDSLQAIRESALKGVSLIRYEKRNVTKSGRIIWVRISGRAIRIDNQVSFEIYAIVEDITANKENESLILKQQIQLSKSMKMSALGQMAGGAAHEINNPLTIIGGNASKIRRLLGIVPVDETKILDGLSKIDLMVDRIAKIVRGLLLFSRDADKDLMVATHVAEIIEDTLALCTERFKAYSIELRVSIKSDAVFECRKTQISQILLNLLSNAFDAVEHLKEKWVSIDLDSDDHGVSIKVANSGPRISQDIFDRIMEPFFTTKDLGKGMGLGLSISKGIAESHHGTLLYDLASEHSCFIVQLPFQQPLAEAG